MLRRSETGAKGPFEEELVFQLELTQSLAFNLLLCTVSLILSANYQASGHVLCFSFKTKLLLLKVESTPDLVALFQCVSDLPLSASQAQLCFNRDTS